MYFVPGVVPEHACLQILPKTIYYDIIGKTWATLQLLLFHRAITISLFIIYKVEMPDLGKKLLEGSSCFTQCVIP
jgi:hypothetical protein